MLFRSVAMDARASYVIVLALTLDCPRSKRRVPTESGRTPGSLSVRRGVDASAVAGASWGSPVSQQPSFLSAAACDVLLRTASHALIARFTDAPRPAPSPGGGGKPLVPLRNAARVKVQQMKKRLTWLGWLRIELRPSRDGPI